jgi:hypothetical protein
MDVAVEKRSCKRHVCEFPVVWCYFNQNQFYKAKLLNYSENGVYLESTTAPLSGATILIKRHHPKAEKNTDPCYEGHREITLAEVRWSHEIKANLSSLYRFGASYLKAGYP